MNVPPRLREMTPEWLTATLRPSSPIQSIEFEEIGLFSNQLWRLRLSYEADGEAVGPRTLVAKLPRNERRDVAGQDLAIELRFYTEWASRIGLRTPKCFFGDRSPDRLVLLMEDVRLAPTSFSKGPTNEHMQRAVDALARLHSLKIGPEEMPDWVPSFADPEHRAHLQDRYDANWPAKRDFYTEAAPDFVSTGDALVGRVASSLAPLSDPTTLLHGDAHLENLALLEGGLEPEVVFHDWASVCSGAAGFDLAVFMVMSFPVERRRDCERACVERHGCPWDQYRLGVLAWMVRMLEFVNPTALSPIEEASRAMIVERCTVAATDHNVADLLA